LAPLLRQHTASGSLRRRDDEDFAGFPVPTRLIKPRHGLPRRRFYHFRIAGFPELREPCGRSAPIGAERQRAAAQEGINGTLAGSDEAIAALVDELRCGALFGGRLDHLDLKFSSASLMPFQRLKIRLKKEIVTLGDAGAIRRGRSASMSTRRLDDLIAAPDTLVIDTRNEFEVAMGSSRAPSIPAQEFGQFKDLPRRSRSGKTSEDRDVLHRRHPLRKASAFLLSRGLPRSITSRAAS